MTLDWFNAPGYASLSITSRRELAEKAKEGNRADSVHRSPSAFDHGRGDEWRRLSPRIKGRRSGSAGASSRQDPSRRGRPRWVDSLDIPANAAHKSSADRFVDFYLQSEISTQVAEFIQAETGNQAALHRLPESVRRNPVIFPLQGALTNLDVYGRSG
jgi:hypothetical protein